jgi:hypothetical protein
MCSIQSLGVELRKQSKYQYGTTRSYSPGIVASSGEVFHKSVEGMKSGDKSDRTLRVPLVT